MTCPPLYLASSSPRRSELLTRAGITFERLLAPIDEDALSASFSGPLERLGEYLAREKALAALRMLAEAGRQGRVLASDTTVLLDGRSLAKPRDLAEAETMLRMLRGREHIVATGVALAGDDPESIVSASSSTRVLMREFSDAEIAVYVATGDPLDKAGAYSIQHPDFSPVERIMGCHLGVIGLPICLVGVLLGQWPSEAPECETSPGISPLCFWSSTCSAPLPAAASIRRMSIAHITAIMPNAPKKASDTP